jgi:hypothetical protein
MTFLAPGFLFASLVVAGVIAGLHFIVVRQPRAGILPTARFIPESHATAVAAAPRPSDLWLMLVRMLVVLLAGTALAKPVLTPSRRAESRVIVVDVSRSARDSLALRDSVTAYYRDGDAVVLFDSSTRLVDGDVADTLRVLRPSLQRGNLGAALIGALRAGSTLRDRADSLELVIVSPFAREELDAAADTIRSLWRGKARLVRVPLPPVDTTQLVGALDIASDTNDPLGVTVPIARRNVRGNALIVRAGRRGDSGNSSAGIGETPAGQSHRQADVTLDWPAASRPPFAIARAKTDTVGGLEVGTRGIVAPFVRRWSYPPDSLRGAEVIGRWYDGEPAAVEKPDGAGCLRSVGIPVTPVGDLVIRRDWTRLVTELARPCASVTSLVPASASDLAPLAGSYRNMASRDAFQPAADAQSALAPWLLAIAIAAAIGELFLRRRRSDAALQALSRAERDEARAA